MCFSNRYWRLDKREKENLFLYKKKTANVIELGN